MLEKLLLQPNLLFLVSTCQLSPLPALVSHKGLDVQIHWNILGWGEGNFNDTREILKTGVDHVALAFKDSFCKDEHCTDDGVLEKRRKKLSIKLLFCDLQNSSNWGRHVRHCSGGEFHSAGIKSYSFPHGFVGTAQNILFCLAFGLMGD